MSFCTYTVVILVDLYVSALHAALTLRSILRFRCVLSVLVPLGEGSSVRPFGLRKSFLCCLYHHGIPMLGLFLHR